MSEITFIDWFAGIGGFRRGLELVGCKCIGFCEYDKYATASYTSMHLLTDEQRQKLERMPLKQRQKEILKNEYRNGEWYRSDIRSVRADDVPGADIWCFGAPCQDFSVAGKRKGLDGDRSSLVREVFRLIREKREEDRPEWLIYENVKGMLSSNRGFDYLAILLEMDELGYDTEWFTFNSKYHGVPQNRERVYTVGHLRARGERKIFPIEGTDGKDSVCGVKQIGQRNRPERDNLNQYRVYSINGLSPCLNKMDGGGREPHIAVPMCIGGIDKGNAMFGKQFAQQDRIYDGTQVATALTSRLSGNVNYYAFPIDMGPGLKVEGELTTAHTLQSRDYKGIARGFQHSNAVAIPVLTPDRLYKDKGIVVKLNDECTVYAVWYEKYQCYVAIRKLTPKECFRLQGWTDDYFEKAQFVNSDSQLYKQAGNGVTVNVVEDIGKRLKEVINENEKSRTEQSAEHSE